MSRGGKTLGEIRIPRRDDSSQSACICISLKEVDSYLTRCHKATKHSGSVDFN